MRDKYLNDLAESDQFSGIDEAEMFRLFGLIVFYALVDGHEYMSLQEIEEAEEARADHPSD